MSDPFCVLKRSPVTPSVNFLAPLMYFLFDLIQDRVDSLSI